MNTPEVKVFHLWLSTRITTPKSNLVVPLNIAAKNNCTWQVDWDSLFRGWNKKYRRCTVKFQLNSDSWTASGSDWESYNGVLVCNLASDTGSTTNFGTALGLIAPIDCPTTGTTTHCYTVNTLGQQQGADVIVPQSNTMFTISYVSYIGDLGLISSTIYDYQILLQFELSEPIVDNL